ncbi:SCO0607 family lipoprotein [Phytohabitans suffuscus]|uniref:Lipoprotein n=1 Tax=Phytohabitans suffuscus TaxID=624315 RepID=A0A6F8YZX7_9ACTN|nr:hypothetical protein [Phytohabitans suffuscus]BCB91740.1 lipoprotein [Phytohabitans suffuscus]
MALGFIRRHAAAVAAASLPAALLAGCGFRDAICGSDQYPVLQVGGTGRQCVSESDGPPAGWTRFPAGKEPKHVDDEWDVYWRTHTIDESGEIVESR